MPTTTQPTTTQPALIRRMGTRQTTRDPVQDLRNEMESRWAELMTLRASPAMYGSESLDGQLAELELWLGRLQRLL